MQTFLPYENFCASAQTLDRQRLGKQRIECKQLIKAIVTGGGWANHPAANMWRGYEIALALYAVEICEEWRSRGYVDNQLPFFQEFIGESKAVMPKWLGNEAFHASHRSNLLRKAPEHYAQFGWPESNDLPYIWPTND